MKTLILILFISLTVPVSSFSQQAENVVAPRGIVSGLGLQAYPAGLIPGIFFEKFYGSKSSLFLRTGWNLIDRKDFSDLHEKEKGNGIGLTAGYRKHFRLGKGDLIAGFNTDTWYEWIDWENDKAILTGNHGRSKVLVLQPWLETGYFTNRNKGIPRFGLTVGFGREINVITEGENVAEGWIGSLSLYAGIEF